MVDVARIAFLVMLAALSTVFWDTPWRLRRLRQEARFASDGSYHVANGAALVVVGAWLLVVAFPRLDATFPLAPLPRAIGVVVAALGVELALWARVTMGTVFSPTATVVQGEAVVTGGPFRFVRHPFYLGILLLLAGGTFALASLGTAVAFIALWPLLHALAVREEAFLEQELGDAYRGYRKRVRRGV